MNHDELLDTAIEAGYRLLENGAEISRVEESIQRILLSYGVESCDVFAIPSCIIVTIRETGATPLTRIKRIYSRETNLGQVTLLNGLCRRICHDTPSFEQVRQSLKKIDESPVFSYPIQILGYALISSAFTLFFGGTALDACVAILCGALLRLVLRAMSRFHTNPFFINLAGSAMTATVAFLAIRAGLADHMDKIIIGTLMNLVPGVAITTSMQDIIAGDLIAGITKLTEALLTATAIALGTGLALTVLRLI